MSTCPLFGQNVGTGYEYSTYKNRAVIESEIMTFDTSVIILEDPYKNEIQTNPDTLFLENNQISVTLNYTLDSLSDVKENYWEAEMVFRLYARPSDSLWASDTLRIYNDTSTSQYQEVLSFNIDTSSTDTLFELVIDELNMTAPTGHFTPADIVAELIFCSRRIDYFKRDSVPNLDSIQSGSQVTLYWDNLHGAKFYEIDYVYFDDEEEYDPNNPQFDRAVRVESDHNYYTIDLTYPPGDLFVRVRGVGEFIRGTSRTGILKPGAWSQHKKITLNGYQSNINWTTSKSFAEEGKKKTSVQYFDDSYRLRQTVVSLNTEKLALISESDYDAEGREAVKIIPTPDVITKDPKLDFRPGYNQGFDPNTLQTGAYSYVHFDKNIADPVSNISGSSYYYNGISLILDDERNKFIPNANEYPLIHTKYKRDNTGRITKQGGVRPEFQIGQQETQYYYGTPTSTELHRLFGGEIGDHRHYRKNVVVDANRQSSVTYTDIYGKTVATALQGSGPDNVIALNNQELDSIVAALQVGENNDVNPIVSRNTIVNEVSQTPYDFTYEFDGGSIGPIDGGCLECPYLLTLYVEDECGLLQDINAISTGSLVYDYDQNEKILRVYYNYPDHVNQGSGGNAPICGYPVEYDDVSFQVIFLNPGEYTVYKKLELVNQDLDVLKSRLEELVDIEQIRKDIAALHDSSQCLKTCEDLCAHFVELELSDPNTMYTEADREFLEEECRNSYCDSVALSFLSRASIERCNSKEKMVSDQLGEGRPAHFSNWAQYMVLFDQADCYKTKEIEILDSDGDTWIVKKDPNDVMYLENQADQSIASSAITIDCNGTATSIDPSQSWPEIEKILGNVDCWQVQWGEALASCHREFCVVEQCHEWTETFDFDSELNFSNWNKAKERYCPTCTPRVDPPAPPTSNDEVAMNISSMISGVVNEDPLFKSPGVVIGSCGNSNATLFSIINNYFDQFGNSTEIENEVSSLNLQGSYSEFAEFITLYIIKGEIYDRDDWFSMIQAMYAQIKDELYWDCMPSGCLLDPTDMTTLFKKPDIHDFDDIDEILDYAKSLIQDYRDIDCPTRTQIWAEKYEEQFGVDPSLMYQETLFPNLCEEICHPIPNVGCFEEIEPCFPDPSPEWYCHTGSGVFQAPNLGGPGGLNGATPISHYKQKAQLQPAQNWPFNNNNPYLPNNIAEEYLFAFRVMPNPPPIWANSWGQTVRVNTASNMCGDPNTPFQVDRYIDDLKLSIYIVDCENNVINATAFPGFLNDAVYNNYYGNVSAEWGVTFFNHPPAPGLDFTYILHFYRTSNSGPLPHDFMFEINTDYEYEYSLLQDTLGHTKKRWLTDIYQDIKLNHGEAEAKDYIRQIWDCETVCKEIDPCFNDIMQYSMYFFPQVNQCGAYTMVVINDNDDCLTDLTLNVCDNPRNSFINAGVIGQPDMLIRLVNEFGSIVDLRNTEILDYKPTMVPPDWIYDVENSILNDLDYAYIKVLLRTTTHRNIPPQPFGEGCLKEPLEYLHVGYVIVENKFEFITSIHSDDNCHPEILDDDCLARLGKLIDEKTIDAYNKKINEEITRILRDQSICMEQAVEEFYTQFNLFNYQYTLYYYDQAENLVRTVPPEAVRPLDASPTSPYFTDGKLNSPTILPEHGTLGNPMHDNYVTQYQYNSFNNPIWQKTPDAGVTTFVYDNGQRLKLSQDAEQSNSADFTYNKYDNLNRVIESGTITDYSLEDINDPDFPDWSQKNVQDVNLFFYDEVPAGIPMNIPIVQDNLRSRLAYAEFRPDENSDNILEQAYSYDVHGNVDEFATYAENIDWRFMTYNYDLISGNVKLFSIQPGLKDQFYTKYCYDLDNRLNQVFTSTDGKYWDEDARYFYYEHGPMSRIELGHNKVQGADYIYTLHGWIKSVNLPGLESNKFEPGLDGADDITDNINQLVGRDAMSYSLGYYQEKDYEPIDMNTDLRAMKDGIWADLYADILPLPVGDKGLYNGNIAWMITDLKALNTNLNPFDGLQATAYQYDQLHRIKRSSTYHSTDGLGWSKDGQPSSFNTFYSYDPNGNLTNLTRYTKSDLMDDLFYTYQNGNASNRLDNVYDGFFNDSKFSHDPDMQTAGNYKYDNRGNMTEDAEGKADITWYDFGKVESVTIDNSDVITYIYDPSGNRTVKEIDVNGSIETYFYLRDPSGNIVSVYSESSGTVAQKEVPIYGSSRLGVHHMNRNDVSVPLNGREVKTRGTKHYEMSNHLGNVLTTITDRRLGIGTTMAGAYEPEIVNAQDYYPFGLEQLGEQIEGNPIAGRTYKNPAFNNQYRFGFNGKEKDEHLHNDITNYDYGARIYNPGIARFLSVDPLTKEFASLTPYQFASNTPIWGIDLDGEEVRIYSESGNYVKGQVGHSFISVGTDEEMIVYTYGRYDDIDKTSLGALSPSGDGVLLKYTGPKAVDFVDKYINKYGAQAYELTDVDQAGEAAVRQFFDEKFNSTEERPDNPDRPFFNDPNARVIDKYNLLDNNCTTISCEGAKESGTKAFEDTEYIMPLKPPGNDNVIIRDTEKSPSTPSGLNQYLNRKSGKQDSSVKNVTEELKNKSSNSNNGG